MTNTQDTSPEAVERLAKYHDWRDDGDSGTAATLRALSAERDALKQSLEKAVFACGDQARARGEAEGKLAASEMAGVVDGWKARAEAAEADLTDLAQKSTRLITEIEGERDALKAELTEAVGALQMVVGGAVYTAADGFSKPHEPEQSRIARAFLARHQKETGA